MDNGMQKSTQKNGQSLYCHEKDSLGRHYKGKKVTKEVI